VADVVIPHYGSDYRTADGNYDELKYLHGIDLRSHQDLFQNFNRFNSIFPHMELDGLVQYVFITRPDLNICTWGSSSGQLTPMCETDPLFQQMHKDHRVILRSLSSSMDSGHDFIPMLVGRTESLQIPDITLRTASMVQPATGYETTYGGNAIESLSSCNFDITFRDDNFLRVTKLFETWVWYIHGLYLHMWEPKDTYIKNNIYDYMCSVYKFDCMPDGQTIVHWQKYTGAFPVNVPLSTLSYNLGGSVDNKVNISFRAQYFEAYNPFILRDFNMNSTGPYVATPMYDSRVLGTGDPMVGAPFVVRDGGVFKLKWRARKTSFV